MWGVVVIGPRSGDMANFEGKIGIGTRREDGGWGDVRKGGLHVNNRA